MAVQKKKKTRSKKKQIQKSKKIKILQKFCNANSEEQHIKYHITKKGFYKNKKIN